MPKLSPAIPDTSNMHSSRTTRIPHLRSPTVLLLEWTPSAHHRYCLLPRRALNRFRPALILRLPDARSRSHHHHPFPPPLEAATPPLTADAGLQNPEWPVRTPRLTLRSFRPSLEGGIVENAPTLSRLPPPLTDILARNPSNSRPSTPHIPSNVTRSTIRTTSARRHPILTAPRTVRIRDLPVTMVTSHGVRI